MSHQFVKKHYSQITNEIYGNRLTNLSFKYQLKFDIIKLSGNGENVKRYPWESISTLALMQSVCNVMNYNDYQDMLKTQYILTETLLFNLINKTGN